MAQQKLDSFFRPKVPRLEESVEDDRNADEEDSVASKDH